MSAIQIVCTNCGAKYRIPDTFKGTQAKCKSCGATIDVAAQVEAAGQPEAPATKPVAATPAAAKPARARPAAARAGRKTDDSDDGGPEHRRARGAGGARSSRRSGRDSSGGGRPRRGGRRRGGEEAEGGEEKKGNTGLLIGGGIGLLAVLVVVLVFVLGGGDDPTTEQTASGNQAAGRQAGAPADQTEGEGQGGDTAAAEADASGEGGEVEEAAAPEPEKKPEPKPAARVELTRATIFNPRTELEPLEWPAYMTDEEKAEVTELVEAVKNGGIWGTRAKPKLEKLGHRSLVGIINALRELDYTDSFQSMKAYEFNRLLQDMTAGNNFGFRTVNIGETVPLDVAHWNARIVREWQKRSRQWDTAEAFDEYLKQKKKQNKKRQE